MPRIRAGLEVKHRDYGSCTILGESKFFDQHRRRPHSRNYFRLVNRECSAETLRNPDQWDRAKRSIKKELSSRVLERINAHAYSIKFPPTPADAAKTMSRHPVLLELSNFTVTAFFTRLAGVNPEWGEAAATAAAEMIKTEVARS